MYIMYIYDDVDKKKKSCTYIVSIYCHINRIFTYSG